ncbi:MAG: ATP-binding cassette domain-containing protein, partial [Planctomycetaceae bacterium]
QNVELLFQLQPDVGEREVHRRCEEMLVSVGLGDRLDYHPSHLSGGQKQRVAIARALALSPSLILADEPTAALDSKSGREVVSLLYNLAREGGCPVLMVTHDNRVLDIADRIVNIEDGRIQPAK